MTNFYVRLHFTSTEPTDEPFEMLRPHPPTMTRSLEGVCTSLSGGSHCSSASDSELLFCWTIGKEASEPICGVFSLTACGCERARREQATSSKSCKQGKGFYSLCQCMSQEGAKKTKKNLQMRLCVLIQMCERPSPSACLHGRGNWVMQDRAQHRREPAGAVEGWAEAPSGWGWNDAGDGERESRLLSYRRDRKVRNKALWKTDLLRSHKAGGEEVRV